MNTPPEITMEAVYWFFSAIAAFGGALGCFVYYGLKRLGPDEEV